MSDAVTLRRETLKERGAIRSLNEAAFGRPDEADLVDRLRTEGAVLASFVADWHQQIVGHILFSRVLIDATSGPIAAVALAPMAVLPEQQRRGVGGQLIRHGLDWLRARGERVVLVLGHPVYYPRFGFSSDRARLLASPFPPDAFMALELVQGVLDGIRGVVRYPDAFRL
jgi:putative acetyltransferase